MRRKVGDIFLYCSKKYIVRQVPLKQGWCCANCAFKTKPNCNYLQSTISGECEGETRGDNINVYYEEVK